MPFKKQPNPAKGIVWDLSDMYSGIDDPEIEKDKKRVEKLTKTFIKKYRGKISSPNLVPELLLQSIKDDEELAVIIYRLGRYSNLLWMKNTGDEDVGKFYQSIEDFTSNISSEMLWYGLEWKDLDDRKANEVLKSPKLKKYRHRLKLARVFKPYTLSEPEEKIINKTDQVSGRAFVRLFDMVDSSAKYELEIDGKVKLLSVPELSPYLSRHKSRKVRKKASKAFTEGIRKNEKIYSYILNTLLLESKIYNGLRGYKYPQQSAFLSDELKPKTVGKMVRAIEDSYGICERFYKAKKKLLGFKELYEWDRYSMIYPKLYKSYSWDEAKSVVLDSFKEFDESFYKIAGEVFDKKWIDAEMKDGKRSGAFCNSGDPLYHPLISMNFKGFAEDIGTLAHELGHGIHSYLSREQPLYEFYPSTPVCEITSIFAEMLVFDKLYRERKDKKVKINLLTDKLQGVFASVFRQNAFYLFESDIHKHRHEEGELKIEEFGNYYQTRLQATFGGGLKLTDNHVFWWMPIMHFYHYNFYVFSYSFGELLTLALYARYKKEGKKFIKDYLKALSMGGSKNPYQLTKMMGVDINSPNFWSGGLKIIEGYVEEFENLV